MQRWARRPRLRTLILAVALAPLSGLVVFASLWVGDRASAAARAEERCERIGLAVYLADLQQVVGLQGTLVVGHYGASSTGVDMGGTADMISVQLGVVRTQVAELRAELDERAVDLDLAAGADATDRVRAAFAAFDRGEAALADEWEIDDVAATAQFLDVQRAVGEELRDVLAVVSGRDDATGATLMLAVSAQQAALRESIEYIQARTLPDDDLLRLSEVHAAEVASALPVLSGVIPDELTVAWSAVTEAEQGWRQLRADTTMVAGTFDDRAVSAAAIAAMRRVAAFEQLRSDLGTTFAAEAESAAARARTEQRVALVAVGILVLATAGLFLFVLRWTNRTLRSLEHGARRVAAGDLDIDPIGLTGRDELAVLAGAFDEMAATLHLVDGQLAALARGEHDQADLARALPGRLGTSLRGSVHQLHDVTARLRSSEAMARAVIDTAAEAIWSIGDDGLVLDANEAAADLIGRPVTEMVGGPAARLLPAELIDPDLPRIRSADAVLAVAGGGSVPVLVSTARVEMAGSRVHTVFARDISERKALEDRLEHEATHDPLTGLCNRSALLARLNEAVAATADAGRGFALAFVDVDRFKAVNDLWGHQAGDHLLLALAERLTAAVGPDDTVGRMGGDEFVLILRDPGGADGVTVTLDRVRRMVAEPVGVGAEGVRVSASIGVAWTDGDDPAPELVRRADLAMYRSKAGGGDQVTVYDADTEDWAGDRTELEHALVGALARDELEAHYQPMFDARDGSVSGVELLTRWNRPGHGPVSPARFIPVAEASGLIVELGRRTLDTAVRQLVAWSTRGHRLEVSVNISGRHLTSGDLASDVEATLARHPAVDPGLLVLELTETFLLPDLDAALAELGRLRAMGIGLAIDDFGTGYSSLTYLRRFPATVLKVDRSFVSRMVDGDEDSSIVGTVVELAHSLGLQVVAEGVETTDQLGLLRAMDCDRVQGFLLGRPVPVDRIDALLAGQASGRSSPQASIGTRPVTGSMVP